jgi:hypothetical protein
MILSMVSNRKHIDIIHVSISNVFTPPRCRCRQQQAAAPDLTSSLCSLLVSAALAETFTPDLLCLCNGYYLGATPAVAPHPNILLIASSAVSPTSLRVGRGSSKTQLILEAMLNRGMAVASNEARNKRCMPQKVRQWADLKAGQQLVAGLVTEHGHSSSLHEIARGQVEGLKRDEIHQGRLFVSTYFGARGLGIYG